MFALPELSDIPISQLYTPNVKPKSWTGFLGRNAERNKIFLLTSSESFEPRRTGIILTWPALHAATPRRRNPEAVLRRALRRGYIRKLLRLSQKESYDFVRQPEPGVACIVARRYYDDPLAVILPVDVLEKLRTA